MSEGAVATPSADATKRRLAIARYNGTAESIKFDAYGTSNPSSPGVNTNSTDDPTDNVYALLQGTRLGSVVETGYSDKVELGGCEAGRTMRRRWGSISAFMTPSIETNPGKAAGFTATGALLVGLTAYQRLEWQRSAGMPEDISGSGNHVCSNVYRLDKTPSSTCGAWCRVVQIPYRDRRYHRSATGRKAYWCSLTAYPTGVSPSK